jgi:hypothetical protein
MSSLLYAPALCNSCSGIFILAAAAYWPDLAARDMSTGAEEEVSRTFVPYTSTKGTRQLHPQATNPQLPCRRERRGASRGRGRQGSRAFLCR